MKRHTFKRAAALLTSAAMLLASSAQAAEQELPLWELGAGVAALTQPHYLGSSQDKAWVLPIPHFKYRGKYIRADRGGLQARLFQSERMSVGISGGGSFPVDSEDDDARQGMPDRDALAEVGPNLRVDLVDNEQLHLQFQWPIRAAFSFGDDFGDYQGVTSNPRLVAKMLINDWTYTTNVGPVFSDQRYHAYDYDVPVAFSTPNRAAFESEAGYTGLRAGFAMTRYFKNINVNVFANYYNLSGAENDGSPLFQEEHNISAGIAVTWVFRRSKTMVTIDDENL